MKQIHPIQILILKKLLFSQSLRYSDIKPPGMESSQFVFHLDYLLKSLYVMKAGDQYALTQSGKEFANRMKTEVSDFKQQPKTTTMLCCRWGVKAEYSYLIYTRLKNPFYGCQGFPTRKVWYGASLYDAAREGLKLECGLSGVPELFAIRHYRVYSLNRDLLEDKIMYLFLFDNPSGTIFGAEDGKYSWIKESKLNGLITDPLEEFWESYFLLKNYSGQVDFKEVEHYTDKF